MDILEELGNKQRASDALADFKRMIKNAGVDPETIEIITHAAAGTISYGERYSFTVIDGRLVMEGPCPKCSMSAWSIPIKSLADISSLRDNFRVGKDHRCMDV